MSFTKRTLLALAALIALTPAALAFPDRPVQIIVPWAAGGGMDSVVRIFAAGFERELGAPVNVVNRTGGGGITGHTAIATASPDGYTIGGEPGDRLLQDDGPRRGDAGLGRPVLAHLAHPGGHHGARGRALQGPQRVPRRREGRPERDLPRLRHRARRLLAHRGR